MSEKDHQDQEDLCFEHQEPKRRRSGLRFFISFLILLVLGTVLVLAYKTSFTFSKMTVDLENGSGLLPEIGDLPEEDPDRTNILLLGIRGADDPNGGLLADAIMVASFKKSTGQVALISFPRDLYVKVPGVDKKEKINAIYAYGEGKKYGSGGMVYSREAISRLSGLYIDHTVVANFQAFLEIVDIIGGVTVYLERPFVEEKQFEKEIIINLPQGENLLDGRTALYYVRSRYSTSDFDRARRQQQVLLAIKEKVLSLGVLSNPIKIFNILDSLGRNVRTDMNRDEILDLLENKNNYDSQNIKKKVFDTSASGLLYSSTLEDGAYILLPVGDNFEQIQEACRNIFQ